MSGWLKDTPGARDQVKDGYCIYSHPNPLGIASPNNPLFNVAPCSTLLHVLCAKQLPTGNCSMKQLLFSIERLPFPFDVVLINLNHFVNESENCQNIMNSI